MTNEERPKAPTRRTNEPIPPPRILLPDSLGVPRSLRGVVAQVSSSTLMSPRPELRDMRARSSGSR